jgi:hypothetical protein
MLGFKNFLGLQESLCMECRRETTPEIILRCHGYFFGVFGMMIKDYKKTKLQTLHQLFVVNTRQRVQADLE